MSGRARRLRLSSAFLTAAWLALCWLYIASEVGWPVLAQLLPHEIGLVVTGVLAPLALLWAMTLAETRADVMATELSRQVALLLATPRAALDEVGTRTDTLESRARDLTALGEQTAQHLERAAVRLEAALQHGAALRLELGQAIEVLSEQLDRASRVAEASGKHLSDWQAAFAPFPAPSPGREADIETRPLRAPWWRELLISLEASKARFRTRWLGDQTNR